MKRPRIKRNRPAGHVFAARMPSVDEFLSVNPLPPELAQFEPILRSPIGQNILDCIIGAMSAGMSEGAMLAMLQDICEFHSETTHRCNTCFGWTDDPAKTGALIAKGRFRLVVTCRPCYERIMSGTTTPEMMRNLQTYGGER